MSRWVIGWSSASPSSPTTCPPWWPPVAIRSCPWWSWRRSRTTSSSPTWSPPASTSAPRNCCSSSTAEQTAGGPPADEPAAHPTDLSRQLLSIHDGGKSMEIVILPDTAAIGSLAADAIESLVQRKPNAVLGLATGSSPLAIYDGLAADIPAFCAGYETAIADAGGVDLQILGIGTVGHIGFNEPGSSLASRTRIKTLTRQTRIDNARFFGGDVDAVPTHCLTQGLGTIMSARHVVLVATGAQKAEAVHHLVEGAVSALWPGTVLQHHPHVTVLLDGAAASRTEIGRAHV